MMSPRLAAEGARVARPGVLTALVVLVVASAGGYGAAKLAPRWSTIVTFRGSSDRPRAGRLLRLDTARLPRDLAASPVALSLASRAPGDGAATARCPCQRHDLVGPRPHPSLAGDSYAGVGWVGALLPGRSSYRTVPVALGVAAFWACLLVAGTAGLGGRLVRRKWLPVHRLAAPISPLSSSAGCSPGPTQRGCASCMFASGAVVLSLWLTRHLDQQPVLTSQTTADGRTLTPASTAKERHDIDRSRQTGSRHCRRPRCGPAGWPATRLLAGPKAQSGAESLLAHGRRLGRIHLPGSCEGALGIAAASGLTGRGGGDFPFAEKLRAALSGHQPPLVVVNGSEGELASRKDRTLLELRPHTVLDGACWTAAAIRAPEVVIYLEPTRSRAWQSVSDAVWEHGSAGIMVPHSGWSGSPITSLQERRAPWSPCWRGSARCRVDGPCRWQGAGQEQADRRRQHGGVRARGPDRPLRP